MFQQLKIAQTKFRSCLKNVAEIKPENKGVCGFSIFFLSPIYAELPEDRTISVPLTISLYIPGELNDAESVIVEVGMRYYVKKVCVCGIFVILRPSDIFI